MLSNLRLLAIVAVSFSLQLIIHHLEFTRTLFGIDPISAAQCAAWTLLGFVPLAVLEARKLLLQMREHEAAGPRTLIA